MRKRRFIGFALAAAAFIALAGTHGQFYTPAEGDGGTKNIVVKERGIVLENKQVMILNAHHLRLSHALREGNTCNVRAGDMVESLIQDDNNNVVMISMDTYTWQKWSLCPAGSVYVTPAAEFRLMAEAYRKWKSVENLQKDAQASQ